MHRDSSKKCVDGYSCICICWQFVTGDAAYSSSEVEHFSLCVHECEEHSDPSLKLHSAYAGTKRERHKRTEYKDIKGKQRLTYLSPD